MRSEVEQGAELAAGAPGAPTLGSRALVVVRRTLGLLAALATALLVAELATRLSGIRPPPRGQSERNDLIDDVPEALVPGLGWALRPGSSGSSSYPAVDGPPRVVEYRINADGFRDRRYARPKPADRVRIAVLGDSATYGTGVQAEETFPKVMEKLLRERLGSERIEVMNCATFNTNTGQQAALLAWRVLDWQPDLVLIVTTVADTSGHGVPPRARDPKGPWESRLVVGLGLTSGLRSATDVTDTAQRRMTALRSASALADFLANRAYSWLEGRVQERNYLRDWEPASPGRKEVERSLAWANALSVQHGAEFRVTLFPFLSDLGPDHPFLSVHRTVEQFCAQRGIGYIDLLQPFLGLQASALRAHAHDRHPNAVAHRIAAEQLARAFQPWARERIERSH